MSDPHTSDSNKLSVLVETDFDRNRLLVLMEEEPQDSLYRSVYKALYSPECTRRAGDLSQPIRNHS